MDQDNGVPARNRPVGCGRQQRQRRSSVTDGCACAVRWVIGSFSVENVQVSLKAYQITAQPNFDRKLFPFPKKKMRASKPCTIALFFSSPREKTITSTKPPSFRPPSLDKGKLPTAGLICQSTQQKLQRIFAYPHPARPLV